MYILTEDIVARQGNHVLPCTINPHYTYYNKPTSTEQSTDEIKVEVNFFASTKIWRKSMLHVFTKLNFQIN